MVPQLASTAFAFFPFELSLFFKLFFPSQCFQIFPYFFLFFSFVFNILLASAWLDVLFP
jgi:hypothetical protein